MALFFTLSAESLESGLSGPGLLDGGSRHRNFVLGVLLHESLELEDDILVDLLHRGFVEFSPKLQNNLRVVCRHVRHHVSFHLQVILGVAFVVTCDSLVKVAQVVEPELRIAFRAIAQGWKIGRLLPSQGSFLRRRLRSTSVGGLSRRRRRRRRTSQ